MLDKISPAVVLTVVVLIGACLTAGSICAQTEDEKFVLGFPGYLIMESVRDTTAGFSWQIAEGTGERVLIWAGGTMSVPDSLTIEPFSSVDIAIPIRSEMQGNGATGRLVLRDGIYEVSEPLLLSDGVVSFHATSGKIEIQGQRIRYRSKELKPASDPRSGYIFLAGMVLLIVVLMRRARKSLKEKAQN